MRCLFAVLFVLLPAFAAPAGPLSGLTVAINAGHNRAAGGALPNGDGIGAHSAIGREKWFFPGNPLAIKSGPNRGVIRESDLAQDIALRLARRCRALGARVVLTRVEPCVPTEAGRFANLRARAAVANRARADVLLDLHANNWQPAGDGYMIFVPHPGKHLTDYRYGPLPAADDPASRDARYRACLQLAGIVDDGLRRLAAAGGVPPYPAGVIRGSGLKVIGYSRMPAVLLEVGAMDRKNDMTLLADAAYRERLAGALAGILVTWAGRVVRSGGRGQAG